ncbi:MAG: alpha/beta hydrolase family protein [Bacteroidaceae bacterium]
MVKSWKMYACLLALCGWVAVTGLSACSDDKEPDTTTTETDGSNAGEDEPGKPETGGDGDVTAESGLDSTELTFVRDELKIYGWMYRPKAAKGQLPAVILSHSHSLTHEAMKGYARMLSEKGFATYCYDFCGGSDKSLSDGRTEDMTLFTEMADLKAVLSGMKALDYVDASRIFLLGSSEGGLVSALTAEEVAEEVAGMVLFYPAFTLPDLVNMFASFGGMGGSMGMGSSMGLSEAYVNALKGYDAYAHIGTFSQPILMLLGTEDILVKKADLEKAVGLYANGNATLQMIEGANHGFNKANLGDMGGMMGGFIQIKECDDVVMPLVYAFLDECLKGGL